MVVMAILTSPVGSQPPGISFTEEGRAFWQSELKRTKSAQPKVKVGVSDASWFKKVPSALKDAVDGQDKHKARSVGR